MSVVSIAGAWPSPGKPFTIAELDRMPDDGHRYELLDGVLVGSEPFAAVRPFAVEVVPARLVAGLVPPPA